jgi:hypothetical protein
MLTKKFVAVLAGLVVLASVVSAGGDPNENSIPAILKNILAELADIRAKLEVLQAPDLVPVPFAGTVSGGVITSTEPAHFCRLDAQGKLHVFVYNQSGGPAGPSVTQVFFRVPPGTPVQKSCGDGCAQVDVPTPGLPAFTGTNGLPIDFPEGCFGNAFGLDDINRCLFKIAVDGPNSLNESNELNNSALGACQGLL